MVGSELQRHFSVWPPGQSQTQEGELALQHTSKSSLHSFQPLQDLWPPDYVLAVFIIVLKSSVLISNCLFYLVSLDIVFRYNTNNIILTGDIESRNALLPVLLFFLCYHQCALLPVDASTGSSAETFLDPPLTQDLIYGLDFWRSAQSHWVLKRLTASLHTKWPPRHSHTRMHRWSLTHTHGCTQAVINVRMNSELTILKNTSCLAQLSCLPQALCSACVHPDKDTFQVNTKVSSLTADVNILFLKIK